MRVRPAHPIAWLVVLLTAGCSAHLPPPTDLPSAGSGALPTDFPTLLSLAANAYRPYGPVESIQVSLEAAHKALGLEPGHELASFFAARAATWLLEFDHLLTRERSLAIAREGQADAVAALAAGGERVEYVFLSGALLGQELRLGRSPGLVKMRRVLEHFERAASLDPSFDGGAPLRALGTLLIKAPPWPTGVGDEDRGLELLEQGADQFPSHPANHLYLGDAQAAVHLGTEARSSYERVLALCEDSRWGVMCETYVVLARAALDR